MPRQYTRIAPFFTREIIIPIGPSIAYIPLTHGKLSLIDSEETPKLKERPWLAWWAKSTQSYYAMQSVRLPNGKNGTIALHRKLLGLKHGDKTQGDHINGNTLDNRKINLRIATIRENTKNQKMRSTNTSGYRGVVWAKNENKWVARIWCDNKPYSLGYFLEKTEAAEVYRKAAEIMYGSFRRKDA